MRLLLLSSILSQICYLSKLTEAFVPISSRAKLSHQAFVHSSSLFAAQREDGDSSINTKDNGVSSVELIDSQNLEAENSAEISTQPQTFQLRGKVNEIDFCMAPSDVSLSRAYSQVAYKEVEGNMGDQGGSSTSTKKSQVETASLTRALNNATNRAVRRILLARSWPSAEALNLSLRTVLLSASTSQSKENVESKKDSIDEEKDDTKTIEDADDSLKCPVPRPILNILMRRIGAENSVDSDQKELVTSNKASSSQPTPIKRGRSEKEWVSDQIAAFRSNYDELPGYNLAESYLECILSLATSGNESSKVEEVRDSKVYDESYRRFITVLKSVGAEFESIEPNSTLTRILPKLVDQDICLSMLDKISIENEKREQSFGNKSVSLSENEDSMDVIDETNQTEASSQPNVTDIEIENKIQEDKDAEEESKEKEEPKGKTRLTERVIRFLRRGKTTAVADGSLDSSEESIDTTTNVNATVETEEDSSEINQLEPRDLGGVLLSAEEPSMTRQLNVLANIVQRALLFGGDQELLVLAETLEADKPAFIQRWYPDTGGTVENLEEETRPGVQFLNCLVELLTRCYKDGAVYELTPPLSLIQSYENSYERLVASLVELGSGYIKPINVKRDKILATIPKTATEEFGRFAEWETVIRKSSPDVGAYPNDLLGSWEVKDEVGGKTIGVSTVVFNPQGEVEVREPLKGLRWRLDPGPTHLDTCTFQVLSDDGAILQYKGFIDRGARLESRFSKRPIKIRGSVTFQMRDGEAALMSEGYRKDMLPIASGTGTTRFLMTKSLT